MCKQTFSNSQMFRLQHTDDILELSMEYKGYSLTKYINSAYLKITKNNETKTLRIGHCCFQSVNIVNDNLYIIGGENSPHNRLSSIIWYMKEKKQWSCYCLGNCGIFLCIRDDKIYFMNEKGFTYLIVQDLQNEISIPYYTDSLPLDSDFSIIYSEDVVRFCLYKNGCYPLHISNHDLIYDLDNELLHIVHTAFEIYKIYFQFSEKNLVLEPSIYKQYNTIDLQNIEKGLDHPHTLYKSPNQDFVINDFQYKNINTIVFSTLRLDRIKFMSADYRNLILNLLLCFKFRKFPIPNKYLLFKYFIPILFEPKPQKRSWSKFISNTFTEIKSLIYIVP